MRLIPGKTKVHVELFRGLTIGDILIGAVAIAMLVLVLISNLPWKLGICIAIVGVTAMLLVRMDEQPNYVYVLHILSFFGYRRHFGRDLTDKMLVEAGEGSLKDVAFDVVFKDRPEQAGDRKKGAGEKAGKKEAEKRRRREEKLLNSRKTPEEVKQEILARREAETQAQVAAAVSEITESAEASPEASPEASGEPAPEPAAQAPLGAKERKRLRKEEDRILNSKTASDEEKNAILQRRAEASKEAMRKMATEKSASVKRQPMEEIFGVTGIKDGFIEYLKRSYYGAVLEIDPVEFRFFSEHRRNNAIESCLGRILRSVHAGYSANIVKLERPIMYDKYLDREYAKLEALSVSYENGVLSEDELRSRVEIEYDRINELRAYCENDKVISAFYYLVLFESDKRQLEVQIKEAEQLLKNGELSVRRLDDRGLAVFLKYTNQLDFDERDVNSIRPEDLHLWAQPETVDIRVRRVEVNRVITHNFRVVNYPNMVGDAWLAGVMSIPGTKVVVKCRPMDRAKAVRNIDRSLQELRGQWSATTVDSRRLEIETHLETLQELLKTLQSDSESLLECNIYITAYDIVATRNNLRLPQPPESELPTVNEMKKNIRRSWQEAGFRLNNMEFDQVQAFIGSQISALDPMAKEGRGISSNTVAACFPWIYAHISDEGGIKLGESDGIPVFIDFFRRDSERVNSNMVIVGKSGSGKSYSTKSLLANLAAEDAKIFILDPENEYTELAGNLHGQIINVGNAQYGRLNPFHIITALDDDEAGEAGPSGSYATHLQFLEEFFRQIMPDCEKDAMEYLNNLVDHMYLTQDITPETDLSKLGPEDYPIFDDLYDQILQEFQGNDNPFTRDMLRTLMNYVAKFSTGGRNSNIWNGPSTITTDENFTVFNFQSMLANRNQTIANAQMLLVLKYIDNEIIKNREYNTKYKARRKIVVVIDEAHVFIDAKYPIALDFMFQLAKRIRKYNGMQIVITQNIKDFVGSEELARKSTAIINACQYSFIFALAPNDIQDLVKLYENAGGINETEQEQIVQAPRGQAFTIMSPTSRSTFQVETSAGIAEMFEEQEYRSHYFSGEDGAENWEAFVSVSREKHQQAVSAGTREAQPESQALPEPRKSVLSFLDEEDPELWGEELDLLFPEPEFGEEGASTETASGVRFRISDASEVPESASGVSFHFSDEEPAPAEQPSAVREKPVAIQGEAHGPEAALGGNEAVFGMLATAISKMADAVERVGMPKAAPAELPAAASPDGGKDALLLQMQEELRRLQKEKDEEIRRLQEELALLRTSPPAAQAPEAAAGYPAAGPLPEGAGFGETWEEDEPGDDEFSPEAEGELVLRFGEEPEDEGFDSEAWEDEAEEDEDENYAGFEDEDYDERISFLDDEDGEDEDGEVDMMDFMSKIQSYAAETAGMSPFARMEAEGIDVMEFTLDDLLLEVQARQESRRVAR